MPYYETPRCPGCGFDSLSVGLARYPNNYGVLRCTRCNWSRRLDQDEERVVETHRSGPSFGLSDPAKK